LKRISEYLCSNSAVEAAYGCKLTIVSVTFPLHSELYPPTIPPATGESIVTLVISLLIACKAAIGDNPASANKLKVLSVLIIFFLLQTRVATLVCQLVIYLSN
jgi:hypothetical protein